jgi:UDPglucose 6-dehydrogenase
MRICVTGLWHLGTVTAACLASIGHDVTGHDADDRRVEALKAGNPPVQEPGLDALIRDGLASERLAFTTDAKQVVSQSDVLWVTHDTSLDDSDHADVDSVTAPVSEFFPHLASGSLVLVSSQLPVGTTRELQRSFHNMRSDGNVFFAYSPENLRLGTAIASFMQPARVVVGLDSAEARAIVTTLLKPLATRVEWMSIESAEMTKHALNAFLATSIVFANEIAAVCESVNADAADVVRALRGDPRIGPMAYLGVGTGFAGGTLGRDVSYLMDLISAHRVYAPLISGIGPSNLHQQKWVQRMLASLVGELGGMRIGVWGLTYKPATDTLRRSAALELCEWLLEQGAELQVHDPAIAASAEVPDLPFAVESDPLDAAQGADTLVVMTPWPEYTSVEADSLLSRMRHPIVIDPGRALAHAVGMDPRVTYTAVGMSRR